MAGTNQKKITLGVAIGIALLALTGCAQPPKTDLQAGQRLADQSVLALNWFQQSGEYQALSHQAFNSAKLAFDLAKATPGKKKAVVVDLDETMLDNSPYSGWQAKQGQPFATATWAKWSQAEQAGAVPGAVQFARYVNSHQGTMFYVSNRKQSEYAATVANMQKLGFTGMSEKTVLLSGDTSNKQPRFDAIKNAGYDIVVYAGDNLNDFGAATYHKDNAQRRAFVADNQSKFGTEYIVLPNPLYGDWESGMAQDYNKLTPEQKLLIRQQAIKAWSGQ
ncbi:5'-nucleotidase, lipoprotein e(P4) family [Serratia quinivorans]|uniref:5'-nucleotidase, lipoprotein e(P4) family n=1 Tax=Serratia quinivorans TaxID=137545 RepID=UPI00217B27EA|nr:5'-nucleotidase, lipoprotein e(P4) family [Serratia quinivorans]CAI0924289.1 Outer membrane protein P4 [Serratia quinivorans]CAI0946377.1 Outer membrane protein P4 [Serratia quinivorans]CAI1535713.1 Outer membrane protein P4 [Serratia quinivorans]CAI2064334.1 Outer membrane protein P4 [Serratia quinivorans]CAI2099228.1 Outer membrane protein P4 [Serratia quinivorans]